MVKLIVNLHPKTFINPERNLVEMLVIDVFHFSVTWDDAFFRVSCQTRGA